MLEMLGGGVLGSLIGGMFRLAPEILKHLDKKNDRAHELSMFDKQCDLEKVRGSIKLGEIGAERDAANDAGVLVALKSAIDQQTEMAKAAGGAVAKVSALVRPVVTYYMLLLYSVVRITSACLMAYNGAGASEVLKVIWTPDDMALFSGVINFWFLDRALKSRGFA